jgi:hypothetical protein
MVELDRGFESKLRAALLKDIERRLVGEEGSLVFEAIEESREQLRDSQYDGVGSIIESLAEPEVERAHDGFRVTWRWTHEAAQYFETGTSDHTIDGDPVLSFIWEDPPQWARDEFEVEGDGVRAFLDHVEVEGLDAVRYNQWGLRWLISALEGMD